MRLSRRVFIEMVSGLTVLGLATFSFVAAQQRHAFPAPSPFGEHASWHPEITRQIIEAGNDGRYAHLVAQGLARNPYARGIERAKQEIELGNSAVHAAAAGADIAPFFRFPELLETRPELEYLAKHNIAIFSTDIDSRDFAMHRPEEVIKSVMTQLPKRGKGIILLHDFHHNTAEAVPELLRQLKEGGYKVVHMVPKAPLTTIPEYDEMLKRDEKLSSKCDQGRLVCSTGDKPVGAMAVQNPEAIQRLSGSARWLKVAPAG